MIKEKIQKWFGVDSPYRKNGRNIVNLEVYREKMEKFKESQPFVYFITETIPAWYSKMKRIPGAITSYISNRFVYKLHRRSGVKPGQYIEFNRIVESLLDDLVNFVEVECAIMHCVCDNDAELKYKYKHNRFKVFRSKEAGLEYLKWEMSLVHGDSSDGVGPDHELYMKPTGQAITAAIVYDIYMWYTVTNAKYIRDIDEALEMWHNAKRGSASGEMYWEKLNELEAIQEKELEINLIKLVQIRNSLWT